MQLTVTPQQHILRIELIETNYVIETLKIEQKSDLVFDAWNEVACLNDTAPYFSWTNQHSAFQNNFYRVRYALGTNHYNGSLQSLIIIPDPPPDPDPDPGGSGHCDAGEGEGEPSTEEPIDLGTVMVSGTLGDHSSSASEAYALTLVATNDTHSYSSPLGSMGAFSFLLKRGRTYRLTLAHADSNNFKECDCCDNPQSCCYDYGCGGVYCEDCPCTCTCNPDDPGDNQDAPDYDYTLAVDAAEGMVIDDPAGILGNHEAGKGGSLFADGKTARLHLPGGELEATDSDNPDRKNRTNLVMVYRDTPRTANLKLLQGGGFPDGHPVWSGSGTSGTTGSPTAMWSGTTESTVTAQLGAGQTKTLPINLIPEKRFAGALDFDSLEFQAVQDAVNTVLDHLGKEGGLDLNGSLNAEFKRVDYHADGSRHGAFIQLGGSTSLAFDEIAISSPPLPIGTSTATFQLEGAFAASAIMFSSSTAFDQSLETPGTVSGIFSSNSTASLSAIAEMGVSFVGEVSLNLTGSTTLHASGGLALNNKKLVACGSVGASDFTVGVTGEALVFNQTVEDIGYSHTFDFEYTKNFNAIIYDFHEDE
jgi:hypothetical protein